MGGEGGGGGGGGRVRNSLLRSNAIDRNAQAETNESKIQ